MKGRQRSQPGCEPDDPPAVWYPHTCRTERPSCTTAHPRIEATAHAMDTIVNVICTPENTPRSYEIIRIGDGETFPDPDRPTDHDGPAQLLVSGNANATATGEDPDLQVSPVGLGEGQKQVARKIAEAGAAKPRLISHTGRIADTPTIFRSLTDSPHGRWHLEARMIGSTRRMRIGGDRLEGPGLLVVEMSATGATGNVFPNDEPYPLVHWARHIAREDVTVRRASGSVTDGTVDLGEPGRTAA